VLGVNNTLHVTVEVIGGLPTLLRGPEEARGPRRAGHQTPHTLNKSDSSQRS
jgi:hypothetical protein